MKLREIIRPQVNEGIKDAIPPAAQSWWAKYGGRITKGLAGLNIAMLVSDIEELLDNISRLPKDKMTQEDFTASVTTLVGELVADYGLPEVMFVMGAVIGGGATAITGLGFIAGVGIGGIAGMLLYVPVSWKWGNDLKDLVEWLVAKYYLGDEYAFVRRPDPKPEVEPAPYRPDAKQQAYRRAQTGMDTPGNPNPRLHPERYPKP
jgi:hypothetical protein